jgi:hypothetical protein
MRELDQKDLSGFRLLIFLLSLTHLFHFRTGRCTSCFGAAKRWRRVSSLGDHATQGACWQKRTRLSRHSTHHKKADTNRQPQFSIHPVTLDSCGITAQFKRWRVTSFSQESWGCDTQPSTTRAHPFRTKNLPTETLPQCIVSGSRTSQTNRF